MTRHETISGPKRRRARASFSTHPGRSPWVDEGCELQEDLYGVTPTDRRLVAALLIAVFFFWAGVGWFIVEIAS